MEDEALTNLKPNSHKYKEEQKRREIKPIITEGKAKLRKKPLGKRFAETFIKSDVEDVKSYIFTDLIVPSVIDLFRNSIDGAMDMFFYGNSGRGRSKSGKYYSGRMRTYNSYDSYYYDDISRPGRRSEEISPRIPRGIQSEVIVKNQFLSDKVRDGLLEVADQYPEVRVSEFYTLANLPSEYTDQDWGWDSVDLNAETIRTFPLRAWDRGGEWVVSLPRPKPLRD